MTAGWQTSGPVSTAIVVAMGMLSVAAILAIIRLVRGPSTPDRVVALELIGLVFYAILALHAVVIDEAMLLSVALVAGLIAFLGTIAFARYLEKKVER